MSNAIFKFVSTISLIVLLVLLADGADAQTNDWSTQGASGCSDQYGSFDAFIPGMRGHGSCNRGGFVPNTNVVVVTNRNATGSGSLDAALDVACPKVILFGVSGLINRGGQVNSDCDNWSVVGASAPGQITVVGATGSPLLATKNSSNWTIDHLTLAAGDLSVQSSGGLGNRDSIAMGTGGDTQRNGILLNNNLIWGGDETVQCYPPTGSEMDEVLYWQNIIGMSASGSGVHIMQNTCRSHATIRTFYIHSSGRTPLIRGDKYFHANNFTANPGYQSSLIQPCDGSASTPDPQTRMNFISNLMARGNNTGAHEFIQTQSAGCTDLQVYEDGNHVMTASFGLENCANGGCTSGFSGDDLKASIVTAAYPTGYVPETIANTQQGYINFATQITNFAGANPTNRLAFFNTLVSQGLNHVDGSGTKGGWGAPSYPPGQPLDGVQAWGGLGAVTPSNSSWDPTSQCGGMPTGAAANNTQSSGLTGLHEWVIGCFYDNVMPAGYREDTLQNYGAPGGGPVGSPPPPPPPPAPKPNPPAGFG